MLFHPRTLSSASAALGLVSLGLSLWMGGAATAEPAEGRSDGGKPRVDPPMEPLSYASQVAPLLADKCVVCHGPDAEAREAGLRLDRPEGPDAIWGRSADGGPVLIPGAPEDSELLRRVRGEGRKRMPPLGHGEPLSADEVALLARWVEEGAVFEEHWAYAPFDPAAPAPPALGDWGYNPIDGFVLRRLASAGLEPAPEAEREALLRRVTLDLTGLPPSPEERAAFLADDAPGAYERVVDRLLASRAYAEHWTSAWMDLARYADSHGFTIDGGRSMWPWRDWVLRSIHADEPYDRFTLRQVAGDLLPGASNADRIATGFHRNTQVNQEGGAKDEENRVNAVHDRVATTGAVWLGTTTACAQCHDHKFDPVSAKDYYRLFAFFDSTEDGGVRGGPATYVASTSEEEALVAQYEAGLWTAREEADQQAEHAAAGWSTWQAQRTKAENGPELVPQLDGSYTVVGQNAIFTVYELTGAAPEAGVTALRVEALPSPSLPKGGPGRSGGGNFVLTGVTVEWRDAAGAWRSVPVAAVRASFEQDTRPTGGGHYPAANVLDGEDRTGWAVQGGIGDPHVLHLDLAAPVPAAALELRLALEQRFGGNHALGRFRIRTRADGASPVPGVPQAWTAAEHALRSATHARPGLPSSLVLRERPIPRDTRLFVRGSYLDPAEPVRPGWPAAFAHLVPSLEGVDETRRLDRLDLARWLTHPDNALVHRVTVNRWWQAFFGAGLVATENDFGLRGAAPSHPELLEWLAREFVSLGFSRKRLHRRIVTSATYRQAARPDVDPEAARLLAAQRRLRLPAESIRDAALASSGLLASRFGGPPVQPPQPDGVFAFTQAVKNWTADEGPDRFRRTLYTRRWRSSLHPFLTTFDVPAPTVTCTRRERSTSPLQALALANDPMFQELARGLAERLLEPDGTDEARLRRAVSLVLGRAARAAELELLAAHLGAERTAAGAGAEAERRAWTAVARVLFNLDEFVTRP